MKKYLSFFRLRFTMGLQYRSAAIAGIITQFIWGMMEVLMFRAFYEGNPGAFPMSLQATCTYVWMQQAFLAFFMGWFMESEIFDSIKDGNIVYELCRPIRLYDMWFCRSMAVRTSKAVLRCFPILIVAAFIPGPYGIMIPDSPLSFLLFLVGMVLGLLVTVSYCMLVYIITFFTISPQGVQMVMISVIEFCGGAVIPLPFFPDQIRRMLELLPFGAMQNVPLRIYSGDLSGMMSLKALFLQVCWLAVMILAGRLLMKKALKKVVVQGG